MTRRDLDRLLDLNQKMIGSIRFVEKLHRERCEGRDCVTCVRLANEMRRLKKKRLSLLRQRRP